MIYSHLCVSLQFAFRKVVVFVTGQAMTMLKSEFFPIPHSKRLPALHLRYLNLSFYFQEVIFAAYKLPLDDRANMSLPGLRML